MLSIKNGEFDHANSYRPDYDQKSAPKEELSLSELTMAKILIPTPLRQYADKKDCVGICRRHRRRGPQAR